LAYVVVVVVVVIVIVVVYPWPHIKERHTKPTGSVRIIADPDQGELGRPLHRHPLYFG